MMCHAVQPRDRIFVKVYGFLSSAKNMGKKTLVKIYAKTKVLTIAKNFLVMLNNQLQMQ